MVMRNAHKVEKALFHIKKSHKSTHSTQMARMKHNILFRILSILHVHNDHLNQLQNLL